MVQRLATALQRPCLRKGVQHGLLKIVWRLSKTLVILDTKQQSGVLRLSLAPRRWASSWARRRVEARVPGGVFTRPASASPRNWSQRVHNRLLFPDQFPCAIRFLVLSLY